MKRLIVFVSAFIAASGIAIAQPPIAGQQWYVFDHIGVCNSGLGTPDGWELYDRQKGILAWRLDTRDAIGNIATATIVEISGSTIHFYANKETCQMIER